MFRTQRLGGNCKKCVTQCHSLLVRKNNTTASSSSCGTSTVVVPTSGTGSTCSTNGVLILSTCTARTTTRTRTRTRTIMNTNSKYRLCHQQHQQRQQHQQHQQQIQMRFKSSIPANATTTATSSSNSTSSATTTTTSSSSTSTYINGIVSALLAASAGILTVSGMTNLIEIYTSNDVPEFDATQTRYDTNTYIGRVFHMMLQCDPYLLCFTNQQIMDAKRMIDEYTVARTANNQLKQQDESNDEFESSAFQTTTSAISNDDKMNTTAMQQHRTLWEAKRLVDSAMNDSGMIVPRPFRMSGYVPYNGPICVAMVSSTTTIPLLFWSWINQSQNALVNYYNRSNSSQPMDTNSFAQSYMIAVTSALTVAFGLATLIQKRYSPSKAQSLLRYVAFPSAVIASSLNCYIVRSSEITTGIPLFDEDGNNVLDVAKRTESSDTSFNIDNDHESLDVHVHDTMFDAQQKSDEDDDDRTTSNIAAKYGVYATTASRAILQAPVYFLPPILVSTFFATTVQRQPQLLIPITTYLLLCSFGFGLPMACAIFPQTSTISAKQVEPYPFQQLINPKTQRPYTIFYYDKGL